MRDKKESIRQRLLNREMTFGTWIQIGNPSVAEILANAGYDWIGIDCEHTDISVAEFTALARGIHGRGPAVLARVRENDTLAIRQVLDMGAEGVIVPLVNSAEDAKKAVAAAKYPPQGIRGYCYGRMNDWGVDFDNYAARANDEVAVIVMIESKEAVENIDAILAVDGVDGIFIGPYDMSGSYGIPGQISAPLIQDVCQRVLDASQRAGKVAGLHVCRPSQVAVTDAVNAGYAFIAIGVDTVFLDEAARSALGFAKSAVS